MKSLFYLYFLKTKGTIRNIFSKPLSAILTFIGILFFVGLFVLMLSLPVHENTMSLNFMVMLTIGGVFAFLGVLILQKRSALFFKQDAHYLFAGPFSKKQVLTYLIFVSIMQGILYGFIFVFYLALFGISFGLTINYLLMSGLFTSILMAFLITLVDFFYLIEVTNTKNRKYKFMFMGFFVIIALGFLAKHLMGADFNVALALATFVNDSSFNLVPLFGWLRYGLVGYLSSDYIAVFVGISLQVLSLGCLVNIVRNFKGDFYEKALDDACWISDAKAKAREGKSIYDDTRKIKSVKDATFLSGAGAIYSKNMLELRKTTGWIKPRDCGLMLFYLAIAFFAGLDFIFYQYYILIIIMVTINNDYIISELKKPFIYLIPDKPLKKLVSLVLPMILKMFFIVVFGLTAGLIVYRVPMMVYLGSIVNIFGYALMFVAGSVWSMRLLKSGNNPIAEQFIKMGVILVAMIPAIFVTIRIVFMTGNVDSAFIFTIAQVASAICNLVVGLLFIISAKNMLKGSNVMAD